MIKLADIIDNGRNITEHDPDFARMFLAEKRLVMVRMVFWEGQRLQEVPLFKVALSVVQATVSKITHLA